MANQSPIPKTAAVYIRVSSDDQLELSPASQLKEIRAYARNNGYVIDEDHIYSDDGITGRSTKKRDGFKAVIAAAKENPCPFDVILVWKFSRFARNQEEAIVYKSLLKKHDVDVISISEPIPDGPFGSLIERIIEWMDEYYSIRLSGEVKRGMKEKVSRGGVVSPPSFGYRVEDGVYIPDDDSDIVRMIYNDYLSGVGCVAIARKLAAMGIKTKRGNRPDNRFVKYILQNPVYIGKLRWSLDGRQHYTRKERQDENAILVEGNYEPIIPLETWEKVQQKMFEDSVKHKARERHDRPAHYMLKGLLKCSACGSTLVQTGTPASPGVQCYKYSHGLCTESHYAVLKHLNAAVIENLEYVLTDLAADINPRIVRPKEKNYQQLLDKEYARLEKIKMAYYSGADTIEEYKQNKEKVQKAIKAIEKERDSKSVYSFDPNQFKKRIASVLETIKDDSVSEEDKNETLRSVIDTIVFHKKTRTVEINYYVVG